MPSPGTVALIEDGANAADSAGLDKLGALLKTIAGAADYLGIDSVIDGYLEELSSRGLSVAASLTRNEAKG